MSLELVEAFGARSAGHMMTMLSILKSATLGMSRETGYCDGELAAIVRDVNWALKITTGVVGTLRVMPDRALRGVTDGLSTATELADMLVRTRGLSFRQAHNVVAKAVAAVAGQTNGRITAALINETGGRSSVVTSA